jgi:hypothetical protein
LKEVGFGVRGDEGVPGVAVGGGFGFKAHEMSIQFLLYYFQKLFRVYQSVRVV